MNLYMWFPKPIGGIDSGDKKQLSYFSLFHMPTEPHICVSDSLHRPLKLASALLSARVLAAQFGATQQLI